MKKRDPKTFLGSSLKTVAGLSPVGVPYDKEQLGQTLSTILPPWIQAGVESVTNKNLYFGSNIVPRSLENLPPSEQYRKNTPEIFKALGKTLNISPLILENIVSTTTGGVGRQVGELASGNIKEGTVDQITRRFSGIREGKQEGEEVTKIQDVLQNQALERFKLKQEAESLVEEFSKLPKDKEIVIYCYSTPCMTGRKIGNLLAQNNIYVQTLNIGWNDWRYYWTLWNHEHEWDKTNVMDYIATGSEPGTPKIRDDIYNCGIEGALGC